jgi:hypothetical protein
MIREYAASKDMPKKTNFKLGSKGHLKYLIDAYNYNADQAYDNELKSAGHNGYSRKPTMTYEEHDALREKHGGEIKKLIAEIKKTFKGKIDNDTWRTFIASNNPNVLSWYTSDDPKYVFLKVKY